MYSPPMPRTVEAIFAKFSEPKNCLGLIMMNSFFSSKTSKLSRSGGNIMRVSSSEELELFGAALGAVAEALGAGVAVLGVGADFGALVI